MITAKVVRDSISPDGVRLTTLALTLPKFLDAEFEKHRMLSSNSSSTRAVSGAKRDTSYIPVDVRTAGKGMQSGTTVSDPVFKAFHTGAAALRAQAQSFVTRYEDLVHKQHLGRYLEPWTVQRKLVTATEWTNFFTLRLAPDAQPEMQQLARAMQSVMADSTPALLQYGEWHLPYTLATNGLARMVSAARCARISYATEHADADKEVELAYRLLDAGHLTPFEHQATPMAEVTGTEIVGTGQEPGVSHLDRKGRYWSGNFRGWIQNRKILEQHLPGAGEPSEH